MKKKYLIILLLLLITGCSKKTYTVTFNTDGGSILSNQIIEEGKTIKHIEEPTKEGYIFVSWQKDGHIYDIDTPITDNITLTATWVETPELISNYTITFNIDGEIKTKTVSSGETVEQPDDPKKINYKFLGWYIGTELYDFNLPVEKDLVLQAKFEKEIITVTYKLDGGSGISSTVIKKGSTIKKPSNPTKFGYHFVTWTHNGTDFNFDTTINEDITLTAIWKAIEYFKVSFDTDGGNIIKTQIIEKGNLVLKPDNPTKEGYTFKYWTFNEENFNFNTKIEEDITLKAVYEKIEAVPDLNKNENEEN